MQQKKAIKKAVAKKPTNTKTTTTSNQGTPTAVFNIDEINELLKAVNKSGISKLKLEKGDIKITIQQGANVIHTQAAPTQIIHAAPAPVAASAPAPAAEKPSAPIGTELLVSEKHITIKSPMIGTFYRSAGPGKPTFANVGDDITTGKVLCIIEAMKLFNEIESEVSGKIIKVLVDDATPVEYDQPLFLVDAS